MVITKKLKHPTVVNTPFCVVMNVAKLVESMVPPEAFALVGDPEEGEVVRLASLKLLVGFLLILPCKILFVRENTLDLQR